MADPSAGTRRIDKVLGAAALDQLRTISLLELRELRHEAEQEEVDLSYLRRLLQGRLDILRAELNNRGGEHHDLLAELPAILAEDHREAPFGLGRHATVEPSRADSHRRYLETLVADVDLSDVGARTTDELAGALEVLAGEEGRVSAQRREVQQVLDQCSAELTRRYRDGEADVDDLLPPER